MLLLFVVAACLMCLLALCCVAYVGSEALLYIDLPNRLLGLNPSLPELFVVIFFSALAACYAIAWLTLMDSGIVLRQRVNTFFPQNCRGLCRLCLLAMPTGLCLLTFSNRVEALWPVGWICIAVGLTAGLFAGIGKMLESVPHSHGFSDRHT